MRKLVRRICKACGKSYVTQGAAKYCSPTCRSLVRSNPCNKHYKQGYYLSKSGRREHYDSSLEHRHMLALDAKGLDWTKYHGIRISYFNPKLKRNAIYIPDFLIKTSKGFILQEMKPYALVGNPIVQAKAQAAREWCQKNAYHYEIVTFAGQV